MVYSEIVRALPTRPDIKELQYSGARFSRGAIARLGQRLQSRYLTHKFQILLPYENWKPGGWTSGNQPASLFSLLDHYDEAQLPDDADPDYFERFIIYIRDTPPVAGGCNGELNDCLYECLKYIYGTFSKMPKSIEKPEYIKKALGLNRDAPIPVSCMDKVEQLAGSLAINIVGDITRISKRIPANDPLDPIEVECTTQQVYTRVSNNRTRTFQSDGNKRGIYTFIDLQRAKKLGLNIQLIQDGKPNALIYDRDARIPGTVIFGEYVHFLFKIKNQGGIAGRVAKRVLNTLWGALCQRKRNYKTLTTDQTDPFTFPEGHTLDSIIPVGSDQWRFQFTNPGNPFKGEYPRIVPFLLARGRKITSEAIQPYKDKVRRIHTDGFILEEQPDSPALFTCSENADTTLKTFKFETAGYCHVKNANKNM
ncbi:hypothetical protein GLOIN_2v1849173 [Rhizophagus irregularis DAOM 181602=DAOM 197198]|nr:hypothetical protein GLOIN_2v1849173 [Rhizophagus irregularis DAOM 181602=DAOM 197198]